MNGWIGRTVLCCCLLAASGAAFAQGRGPGGGGPGGGGPGGGGPGGGGSGGGMGGGPSYGNPRVGIPDVSGSSRGSGFPVSRDGGGGGGLQLGPPGRWWDDKSVAKSLGLSKEQQKRMDGVFNSNKTAILESYKALQKEESRLRALSRDKRLDEAKIFAEIDSVAQARAALEKANAHMLLQVRQEMDAQQNARMGNFQKAADDE